jgi:hypothetical protein
MAAATSNPPELRAALNRAARNERIIWACQCDPLRLAKIATVIWVIGIPWTAVIVWDLGRSRYGGMMDWVGLVFLMPFLAIGLGMMSAPLLAWIWSNRTIYGVSDRTFYMVTQLFGTRTKSLDLKDLKTVSCSETANGTGDLTLVFDNKFDTDDASVTHIIWGMPDVRQANDFFEDVRTKLRKS